MTGSTLGRIQARYQRAIDAEVNRLLQSRQGARPFYTMMQYQFGYTDAHGNPVSRTGGKRFRPALCLLACEAVSGNWRAALTAAAGIELVHNFSLIHDDIEDHDPIRHHRDTVWRIWGEPHAINAGDGMHALAHGAFLHATDDPVVLREVARAAQHMTLDLTEGQYLDMSFEREIHVRVDDYMKMISLKTGTIIAFSLWCGARLGNADVHTTAALATFGMAMGRAFQIGDDIAGIWARRDRTGKEEARDLLNRKKTLPVLLAYAAANPEGRRQIEGFYARRLDDLDAVRTVLEQTAARSRAHAAMEECWREAGEALESAAISETFKTELQGLARELAGQ